MTKPQQQSAAGDLGDVLRHAAWWFAVPRRFDGSGRPHFSRMVLDLLLQAQAAHLKEQQPPQQPQLGPPGAPPARAGSRGAADRLSARLAYLIAEQQVETHNLMAARKLLLQVVYTYRR